MFVICIIHFNYQSIKGVKYLTCMACSVFTLVSVTLSNEWRNDTTCETYSLWNGSNYEHGKTGWHILHNSTTSLSFTDHRRQSQRWSNEINNKSDAEDRDSRLPPEHDDYIFLFLSCFAWLLSHVSFNLSFENNTNTVFFLSHILYSLFDK